MKNKNKNHISDIALGEFSAAFAFVIFSMVFSSASAQISQPIPTLPVDGHTTLQTPRPDTSLLSGDYSLLDHLSWNPISNAQAAYNYASWSLLGTYSDNVNGTNYTFTRLPNDGVQAQYTNPYGDVVAVAKNNPADGGSTLTSSISGGGNTYATTYYQNGSKMDTYTPQDHQGDAFTQLTNADGSSKLATYDSQTGFDKHETYSPQGEKIGEYYLSPTTTLPDGSTGQLQFAGSDPTQPKEDQTWGITPVTQDETGNLKQTGPSYVATYNRDQGTEMSATGDGVPNAMDAMGSTGQWDLEQRGTNLSGLKVQPDPETQYSGLKADQGGIFEHTHDRMRQTFLKPREFRIQIIIPMNNIKPENPPKVV